MIKELNVETIKKRQVKVNDSVSLEVASSHLTHHSDLTTLMTAHRGRDGEREKIVQLLF